MNRTLLFALAIGMLLLGQAQAQSFTYTIENNKAIVTGFSAEPSGTVTVPATTTISGTTYTVTEIGRSAFKDRTGITSISFAAPANITKIGATAFQGCTGLQTISLPTGIAALPGGLLQDCSSLTSVTIGSGVTTIGDAAFAGCRSLTTVSLPAGLVSLGDSAFSNCRSLSSLVIPSGVAAIPGQLFAECRALTSVSLPAGITQIGYGAFYNCAGLTSFVLPTGVTSVARDAFRGCKGLTSVAINSALASIGDRAFLDCSNLGAISVDAANAVYSSLDGVLFNQAQTSLVLYPSAKAGSYAAPATVTAFAAGAFAHSSALTSVTIPSGVTTIADDAFYYATSLTSLNIPEGVTSIGAWAAAGTGLTNIVIPASVASIGNDAFHYDALLGYALFNGNAPALGTNVFSSAGNGFTIYYFSTQTGFSSPTWLGYPATALSAPRAFVAWLRSKGLSPAADPLSDSNSDGVSLLLAYALGLNPTSNLASSLPTPVVTLGNPGSLSLTFQGSSEGITYEAQTSTDLLSWTTNGVVVSAPDANGLRTATASVSGATPAQFIRLVVSTAAQRAANANLSAKRESR